MKLKIEIWLAANKFSADALHLFNNGIICYKAEAYTASLLMSYLGFLIVVKDRLMVAKKPALLPQGQWDDIIRKIQREDTWEAEVFEALKLQERIDPTTRLRDRDPIFPVNDSIRQQFKYWKDRRNDCAHHKDNEITNAHVEIFWSFLISNLPKITVEGGFASLINKFDRHYDTAYTPANADTTQLIHEISSSIEKNELQNFWSEVFVAIYNRLFDWDHKETNKLIHKIFQLAPYDIVKSLLEFMKENESYLLAYIKSHPEIIQQLDFDDQDMRNFWKTKVIIMDQPMNIFASMLRNKLIKDEEISEANTLFAYKYSYPDNYADHLVLEAAGFGKAMHKLLFVDNDPTDQYKYWKFLHSHYYFVRQYIEYYDLTEDVVKILSKEFDKDEFYSFHLAESLNNLFSSNTNKKEAFVKIAAEHGITLPKQLTALF